MYPTLQIGPLSIATPGLIILIGLWIALELAERRAHHHQVAANLLYTLTFYSLLVGLLGARLAFVVQYPEPFLKNPLSLLSLNPGMLDRLAGLLIGIGFFLIYTQRVKAPLWNVLDALTPGIVAFSVALSLSQLAAGTFFGLPTSLPWGIRLWEADRHPTQIYMLVAALSILGWVWFRQARMAFRAAGALFLAGVSLLSAAYLLVSGFRADSPTIYAGIRSEQVIAWVILALGLWLYQKRIQDRAAI